MERVAQIALTKGAKTARRYQPFHHLARAILMTAFALQGSVLRTLSMAAIAKQALAIATHHVHHRVRPESLATSGLDGRVTRYVV